MHVRNRLARGAAVVALLVISVAGASTASATRSGRTAPSSGRCARHDSHARRHPEREPGRRRGRHGDRGPRHRRVHGVPGCVHDGRQLHGRGLPRAGAGHRRGPRARAGARRERFAASGHGRLPHGELRARRGLLLGDVGRRRHAVGAGRAGVRPVGSAAARADHHRHSGDRARRRAGHRSNRSPRVVGPDDRAHRRLRLHGAGDHLRPGAERLRHPRGSAPHRELRARRDWHAAAPRPTSRPRRGRSTAGRPPPRARCSPSTPSCRSAPSR